MNFDEIIEHFERTNALRTGHFILSSGLHSPQYLQCALALEHPADAVKFGAAIAEKIAREMPAAAFNRVVSPAIGGLIIGFAVAQKLNLPFFWTERENNLMTVRRGFAVNENDRILVIEDVITTGGSTRECIRAVETHGAKIVAAASIIDRSNGAANVGVSRIALAALEVPAYESNHCPLCASGDIAVKPGSRLMVNGE